MRNFLWHHALLLVALQKISLLIMVVQAIRELVQLSFLNLELEMEHMMKVKGKGTVAIEGLKGLKLISNALYAPKFKQNLLSVGQLLENGYMVLFEDINSLIIDAQDKEVFKVQIKGKIFTLNMLEDEQVAVHKENSNTMLWHRRLRHFHHKALLFMKKKNVRVWGEGLALF